MITRELFHFSLPQIRESGQCFRMERLPGDTETDTIVSGGRFLAIRQDGTRVTFYCDERDLPYWESYLDLDTDYGAIIQSVDPDDAYLQAAARAGSGIRILRQDPWEMILTFLISQQKTIPAIRSLVGALCIRYGEKRPVPADIAASVPGVPAYYYTFPTPKELSAASLDDLLAMKLGYRAKYIRRTVEAALGGELDLAALSRMKYGEAMEYLKSFYGIGEKVANCICLFGLHQIDAFPVDTWIQKILLREYAPKSRLTADVPKSRLCGALVSEFFSAYRGFAGVMQQYIFYYERNYRNETQKRP